MDAVAGKNVGLTPEGNSADENLQKAETAKQLQCGELMKTKHLEARLEGIHTLLSHLHGEVTALEESYTQVLRVIRKLEGACETDDLTGLLRRRPFFQKWEVLLEECRRFNDDCGIILIDIDHFKRVNDTFGHPAGDEVIKRIASMLKQFQSPSCVVSRYGGEEFALAVQGSNEKMLVLAETIRQEAEGIRVPVISIKGKSEELSCTLSVGVASARSVGYDAPRLLQSADIALYDAKSKGRNRVKSAA
jgi:diguanylate cyclase (GGDEF)-like protein